MATVHRAPALATLAALLALAGCGGASLSDQDLRADATAVCAGARTRTDRIPAPHSSATGLAFLRRGAAALEPELAALRALTPPSDTATGYGAALSAFATALGDLRATIDQLGHGQGPEAAYRVLESRLVPVIATENVHWQALQIPACVQR